jgi:hypothetical protein
VRRLTLAPTVAASLVALLLVTVIGGVAVAAKPAPSMVARAGAGVAGGSLNIVAKVKHPARPNTFAASAVAHFPSGDVAVTLRRAGRSFTAVGRLPIPDDATPGRVAIDVTISYAGADNVVSIFGKVVPDDD